MNTNTRTTQFAQFRPQVYQNFNKYKRAAVLMDLVDALASNTTARSPVELSLQPRFRRHYTALFKAVADCRLDAAHWAPLAAPILPRPQQPPFWLLGVDVSPQPRPYARTLQDRSFVYQPTVIRGNKPVTLGHQYSLTALLPEKDADQSVSWVVPRAVQRVASHEDKELVGAQQVAALLRDPALPFHKDLCVEVADSSYSKPAYLCANRQQANLVTITRVRGNRTFYQAAAPPPAPTPPGYPT